MPVQQRLRVTFGKGKSIQYISHLDVCLAWDRALRRAGVPVAYSQGFNPQPRLQLAAALPVGYTSCVELMDVFLEQPWPAEEFMSRVAVVLPAGLSLVAVQPVELKAPALQPALRQAEYRVTLATPVLADELAGRMAGFLAAQRFEHQRTRKQRAETVDLRQLVHDLRLESADIGQAVLWMRLSAGPAGNLRPETVLSALGLGDGPVQVQRTRLIFEFDTP